MVGNVQGVQHGEDQADWALLHHQFADMLVALLGRDVHRAQVEVLDFHFSYFSLILVTEIFHGRLRSEKILKRVLNLDDVVQSWRVYSCGIGFGKGGVPMGLWLF